MDVIFNFDLTRHHHLNKSEGINRENLWLYCGENLFTASDKRAVKIVINLVLHMKFPTAIVKL